MKLNRPWNKWKKRIKRYYQDIDELRKHYENDHPNDDYPGGFRFYYANELESFDWEGQPLGPPRLKHPEKTFLIPPLCIAAQTSIEMTSLLIESGADPLDTSLVFSDEGGFEKTKYSAIYYAASTGRHLIIEYLRNIMKGILSPKEAIYMLLMDDKKTRREYLPYKHILKEIEYAGEKEPVPDFSSKTIYRPFIDLTKHQFILIVVMVVHLNVMEKLGLFLAGAKLGSESLPGLDYFKLAILILI